MEEAKTDQNTAPALNVKVRVFLNRTFYAILKLRLFFPMCRHARKD